MEEKPDRGRSKNLRSLAFAAGFLKPYRGRTVAAVFALLFTSGATLSIGFGLRWMIDRGLATDSIAALNTTILQFAGIVVVVAIGTYVRHYFVSWLGERLSADIRMAVYSHVAGLHPSYFEENHTGEIQTRITTDTAILQSVFGSSISIALRNALTLIGAVALLFYTVPSLTAIVLLAVPLAVVPILFFGRMVRKHSRAAQDRLAEVGSYVGESLRGIKTVQANNHQSIDRAVFSDRVRLSFESARRVIGYRSILFGLVMALGLGAIAIMLRIGGEMVINEDLDPGELVQFGFYAFLVASSLGQLSDVTSELQRAAGATERLAELYNAENLIQPPENPVPLPGPVQGRITVVDLLFRYPTRPDHAAVNKINFELAAGQTVALVGPSGAGKSTLFDLLLRFYDPTSGEIQFDGIDIRKLDPHDLRKHIALVPQEPVLFSTSLYENVRYSRPEATRNEVEQAVHLANAMDFVRDLPEGLDTYLGESGIRLSGGQKQRVAIARAILKDPRLLLLDEATSALDAESEHRVQQALNALMQDRTTIVIAHRLATVLHADEILVMDEGSIVDRGTHARLKKSSALYARLAELQFEAHQSGV